MKFCTHCGQPITDDAAFCSSCGNAVKAAAPFEPVTPPPLATEPFFEPTPAAVTYADETAQLNPQEYVEEPSQPVKKTFIQKIKALTWKGWAAIAAVIIALGAGAWFLVDALSNTYETPVKLMIEQRNAKKFSWDLYIDSMNGFAKKEVKAIFDILDKSDYMDDLKDDYSDSIEYYKEEYGSNYKYSYKIEDKEKLETEDCEDFEDELNEAGEELIDNMDEILDEDVLDSLADELGLSTSQTKKFVNAIKDLGKVMKKAKVTEGYKLKVTITLTGSNLDEPMERETTIYVFKVDGRWISEAAFKNLSFMF